MLMAVHSSEEGAAVSGRQEIALMIEKCRYFRVKTANDNGPKGGR